MPASNTKSKTNTKVGGKNKTADKKILKRLEKEGIEFELIPHKKVFTAYDLAQTAGLKLNDIAKTLLIKVEMPEFKKKGRYYVVVVPASYHVNLQKIKKALKATKVEMVPEKVFKKLDIEPGALSPFGSLRDFGVLVDKSMLRTKEALIGAESFVESIRMKMKDLVELEQAIVDYFSDKNDLKLQKKGGTKKSTTKKTTSAKSKKTTTASKTASRKTGKSQTKKNK